MLYLVPLILLSTCLSIALHSLDKGHRVHGEVRPGWEPQAGLAPISHGAWENISSQEGTCIFWKMQLILKAISRNGREEVRENQASPLFDSVSASFTHPGVGGGEVKIICVSQ